MAQTKRFTIEANKTGADPKSSDTSAATAEKTAEHAMTLDDIKAAVTAIVRDELSNWSGPEKGAPAARTVEAEDEKDQSIVKEIFFELGELQKYIVTSRQEIAALKSKDGDKSQFNAAKIELQEIVDATAKATNDILAEAEKVTEIQASLAEKAAGGEGEPILDEIAGLENASMQIMLACGFQDLTGQRINKVVNTLIFVEDQINKLLDVWNVDAGTGSADLKATREDDARPDKDLLNGPQSEGEGISQDDIDAMFA